MKRVRLRLRAAALAAVCWAPLAGAEPPARERRVEAADLLLLHELGAGRTGLALSPDGTLLAVMQRQTDLERDLYQYDLLVMDARVGATARSVGDGGGFILDSADGRRSGASAARTPLWSPDGNWLAYLAERDGRAELWLSSADGLVRRALAGDEADVERFAWLSDGSGLVVETNTPRQALAEALALAIRDGFRADDRFEPGYSLLPAADEDGARQLFVVTLADGTRRAATPEQAALFAGGSDAAPRAQALAIDPASAAAEPERQVSLLVEDGRMRLCAHAACRGDILAAWLSGDGSEIYFQREEGPARDLNAFYAWTLADESVRLIRRAEERMMDCAVAGFSIFCLQEFSAQPRRIVTLDAQSGELGVIYDPNPHWREFALPRIERLDLAAGRYEASYAHLIYPNDYRRGRRYPLIVVQYRSRGFLRWGTGAQLPIFAAAASGYFVLSLERPQPRALERTLSYGEIGARTELDGSERAMKLDQLDRLLDLLTERGLIDTDRVALTGMSDGAETLYAAIARGRRYGAASVGSQPIDALNWQLTSEAFRAAMARESDLVGPWADAPEPWRSWWEDNIVLNRAEAIATPLLFNLSESEALYAWPLLVRLREQGLASEAYIYPGAYHLKWRPRQILAMQQRTMAWFDFWLRGREDNLGAEDRARWREMRRARASEARH